MPGSEVGSSWVPQVTGRSSSGTKVSTGDPGEKPSLWFHSVGSMGWAAALLGSAAKATRRPVSVVASAAVNRSLGNGSRQSVGSSGSHAAVGEPARAELPAPMRISRPASSAAVRAAARIPESVVLGVELSVETVRMVMLSLLVE